MAKLSLDEMTSALVSQLGWSRDRAEAEARRQLGIPTPAAAEMANVDEDAHVEEADRLMLALGFEIVKLSQKRRSKVTEGIPDRRYYHRRRRVTLWWEAKSDVGKQRPDQRAFQEMVEACDETYVLGNLEALKSWLVSAGVATRDGEIFQPTPIPEAVLA